MNIINIKLQYYRRYLLRKKHTLVKKGDTRFNDTYYCNVCGRPLVTFNGEKYVVQKDLLNFRQGNNSLVACARARDCKAYRIRKYGNDILTIGASDHGILR